MVLCGFFLELMKRNSSANKKAKKIETNMRSKYSTDLNSYASACQEDSDLKSFDSSLHYRTNKVISSLDTESLSLESLMEVYGFLFKLSEDAIKVIIESREDIWKNKDLKSLVDVYFESTLKTLEFCNTVENCVKKTEVSQLLIELAVKRFDKESLETDLEGDNKNKNKKKKKKYAKTLEELKVFKAMGDPFDEFKTQYESVYDQQVLLLEKLSKLKVKLDKKHRNLKIWRTVSNVVFVIAFVSVFVLSVAAAAMNAPPVVSAVAAGLTAPIELAGRWCSEMWEEYEKALERQKDLVLSMESRTTAINNSMETIRVLAENLRIRISLILDTVEIAVERGEDEEEEEMRLAMQKIREQINGFTEKIKLVGEAAAKCINFIVLGRFLVLDHILKLPVTSVS